MEIYGHRFRSHRDVSQLMSDEPAMSVTSFPLPPISINRRKLLVGGAASLLLPPLALAQTSLSVTQGNFAPMPIAIPNFVPGSPEDTQAGADVVGVITNDLKRSGLFAPIDQSAFIGRVTNIDAAPQFQDWKAIHAQALVVGRITRQGDGRLKAEFRLWDV